MKSSEQLVEMLNHVKSAYHREASLYHISGIKEARDNMKWYEGQIIALNYALDNSLTSGLKNPVTNLVYAG